MTITVAPLPILDDEIDQNVALEQDEERITNIEIAASEDKTPLLIKRTDASEEKSNGEVNNHEIEQPPNPQIFNMANFYLKRRGDTYYEYVDSTANGTDERLARVTS